MIRFGGTDGDHLYNDIWAFDLQARAWAQVPAVGFIPVPRTDFAAAAVNGVMYVFGGRGPDGQDLGDLCAFKMRSKFQMYDLSIKNQNKHTLIVGHRWYMFQNMGPTPSARYGLSLTAVREKMFVIGGDASSGKLEDVSFAYILDSGRLHWIFIVFWFSNISIFQQKSVIRPRHLFKHRLKQHRPKKPNMYIRKGPCLQIYKTLKALPLDQHHIPRIHSNTNTNICIFINSSNNSNSIQPPR